MLDKTRSSIAARWGFLTVGAMVMLVVYALTLSEPDLGLYHDDGIYVVTAKALAEGQGYRIISLPDKIPQTKYPILFPLTLSAIWKIAPSFPANVTYLKLLSLVAALLWLWIVYRLLTRETGRPRLASGIVLLTAASPAVVRHATILLAETFFAVLAWAGLWMLVRYERGSSAGRLVWASLLCAAAFHARTIGFTLIAAGIISLAIKKEFRGTLLFGALSGALILPWLFWSLSQAGAIPEFYAYYTSAQYRDWNVLFGFTIPQKLSVVAQNAFLMLAEPGLLMGFSTSTLWPVLVLTGVLFATGFFVSARRRIDVAHAFVALYVATLLLWAWPDARFLLPVFPLLLFYAALGGEWIIDHMTLQRLSGTVTVAAIVLLAFVAGWGSGTIAANSVAELRGCRESSCERDWEDFMSVMTWLKENTPPDAILMGVQDPMLYLYTGRKAVRAFDQDPVVLHYTSDPNRQPFGPPERLAERMVKSRADYLVLTQRERSLGDRFLWQQFHELQQTRPRALKSKMTLGSPRFGVYRINREALVEPNSLTGH